MWYNGKFRMIICLGTSWICFLDKMKKKANEIDILNKPIALLLIIDWREFIVYDYINLMFRYFRILARDN